MKKYSLHFGALAVLITMSSAAQAAGNIASVSVIPANPTFGQTVKFKVATSTPSECWANVSVQNTAFGLIVYEAHVTKATIATESGETFPVTLGNSGTYTIVAEASSDKNPKCTGQANLTFEVARPKLNLGSGPDVGTITGVTVLPANPIFGQTVKFKVTTSNQNECWASVGVQNAGFGLIAYDAHISNAADSGETLTTPLSNGGTYTIVAEASSDKNPKCKGKANFTFEVKRPKLHIPAGPTVCPDPYKIKYGKGTGPSPTDFEKGEATCTKPAPECPAGFTAEFDTQTAVLQCTPIITATCPPGWTGGAYKSKLICTSIKQPHVSCPTSDKWEWGTHYDTESWNSMGCYPNNKPAY